MSSSSHSPTDLQDHSSTQRPDSKGKPSITRLTFRPVRPEGFGNRFPVMFDHRDDIPRRELAHWGPGSRMLVETLLIPAIIIILAAIIMIIWFLA
ncbi:MAG TPA: hypothetical protein VNZ58_07875 [Thermomicrobiales bacterium]|nr:hypothetical protein [Thermomicrobiales bacterium]